MSKVQNGLTPSAAPNVRIRIPRNAKIPDSDVWQEARALQSGRNGESNSGSDSPSNRESNGQSYGESTEDSTR